jgi:AcrR family transcriptional regulator
VKNINTIVTSKEAILATSRELAAEQGLQSLNMRTVAKKCNVSVGSVYNYFPSKSDLIAAVIQDVWQSIFNLNKISNETDSFVDYVIWIFESVQEGVLEYPGFFMAHSMSFAGSDKEKGRQVMTKYFGHMKSGMLASLQKDRNVKLSVFTENFTQKDFVDFIFSNIITLLMKQEHSCTILTEIIRRMIY